MSGSIGWMGSVVLRVNGCLRVCFEGNGLEKTYGVAYSSPLRPIGREVDQSSEVGLCGKWSWVSETGSSKKVSRLHRTGRVVNRWRMCDVCRRKGLLLGGWLAGSRIGRVR